MTIKASNNILWIRRYKSVSVSGGVLLPDSAQKKLHKGRIVTVGKLNNDPEQKDGKTAVFNKSAGFEIEEEGVTYLILSQGDIVGCDDYKNEEYQ